MDSITLGEIGVFVTFAVGLITGFSFLHNKLKEYLTSTLKEEFQAISKKIDGLSDRVDDVDMNTCKNYLVSFLSEVDQNQPIDDVEKERFWEQYDHYEKLGGNSYIHRKVEQLKSDGKL